MRGISNLFIDKCLKNISVYKGVFSSNNIPSFLSSYSQFSIVVNFSPRGEKGSHFISIICEKDKVIYIDSLGLPCLVPSIKTFLSSLNRSIFWNCRTIQSNSSNFCGFYCMFFILYYSLKSNQRFKIYFSNELELNDEKCVLYIKKVCKLNKIK